MCIDNSSPIDSFLLDMAVYMGYDNIGLYINVGAKGVLRPTNAAGRTEPRFWI